jgi:hypothetical protein
MPASPELTPASAGRSVEKSEWNDVMRKKRAPLTTGIAILTLLATIIAPLCGPLCARAHGCGLGKAPRGSQVTECHHAAMADEFDASQTRLAAVRLCASSEFPAATLIPNTNWDELRTIRMSVAPALRAIAGTMQLTPSLGSDRLRWRPNRSPHQTHDDSAHTPELRI